MAEPIADAWSLSRCPSCGAVITQPPQRLSHTCRYCASALVEADRGRVEVDKVAPFRLPAAAALMRLHEHLASRLWAPQRLRRAARDGRVDTQLVEGVLVPFYAYDATCRSRYETKVGVRWSETKRVIKDGKEVREVQQHTEWFPLRGTAVARLHDHLVSASVGLSAADVAGLQPFDLGRARPFDARLLAGWPAELPSRERYQTDADALAQLRAQEMARIEREHLPGDTHRGTRISCQVQLAEAQLVLLPVWVAVLRYGGRVHRLVVNGQTGRCHGRAPVSPTKVALAVLAVAIVVGLVVAWRLSS
ncbi:MAG: hypothetical protein AB1Z98_14890 [Nannocystaceae bacterium]